MNTTYNESSASQKRSNIDSERLLEQSRKAPAIYIKTATRLINIPNLGTNGLISNLALRR